jgi:hypothetical protein
MEAGWLLFNAAHHERRPQASRAAFRLLGCFSDASAAKDHAASMPRDCDLLLASMGVAFALTRSLVPDEGEHCQRLLDAHARRLKNHEEEFIINVAKQKTGEVSGDREVEAGPPPPPMGATPQPDKIPRHLELRHQNFAVLSVVHDTEEAASDMQEPAVIVWGIYDTEDAAKEAIRKKHSLQIRDLNLDVCSMYEWLQPTEVSNHLDEVEEEFRDETLTSIIAQRKNETRSVKAFRALCGEHGAPLVDFSQEQVRRSGFEQVSSLGELSEGASVTAASGTA